MEGEEQHKEGEEVNAEENPEGEQVVKEEKPINPNSFIPVMEDMYKLFGEVFLDNKMEVVKDNKEVFDCTILGVLFSAGWGSPCRIFYKDLINIYNQMNDGEKIFEIIQVSFDAKEEDFKKAISGLPWKFLPLNFAGINELKKKYNVLTIPKFFPIDKTGKSLSDRGREDLLEYGVDICEKWNEDARVAPDLIYEPNEHGQEQGENQNENSDNKNE
jgi:hypothetical protein